jgi:hypothetical protein
VRSVIPPGSQSTYLYGIDARATRDAWVTGYYYSSGSYLTLAEHWNGTRWRIVPTPNLSGAISNALLGVTSLTKDDAWASGYSYSSGDVPLIAHWDGTRWTSVPPASGLSAK